MNALDKTKGNCQFGERCAPGHGFLVEDIFKRCRCGPEAVSTCDGSVVLECAQVLPMFTTSGAKRPSPFVEHFLEQKLPVSSSVASSQIPVL